MIDLRSDTVTKPDDRMRDAAYAADVGDAVYGEDPTVNELEERAADVVGTEAALYVPSGTMGNQIAARVHTERGQELLTDEKSHIVKYELGGAADLSGLQVRMVDADRGIPTPEQIANGIVQESLHRPGTGLAWLENTHNARGGLAIEPEKIDAAAKAAHERDVPVHLDGARMFNAATALDVPVTELTEPVDSVMFCLSKGLGAPIGSMLAGSEDFVEKACRVRKLFGGGLRQAGIIAAPGLEALGNVDNLERDHEHAQRLADGLEAVDGFDVQPPETNIVLADISGTGLETDAVLDRLREKDVLATQFGPSTVRFCTHWNVSSDDVETVLERIETAV
ncbi:threonine aldolase family protein [Natronobacterium gregoryi]|uniref:Threonine aldolase n=2 Tax=Natronobacterium gregoryi TaxID=44930 RepID=L0AGH2_NATGS|nr:GntG family PLP-dependent aldolase [Natronobacterium gregoryi]AFZ73008.1 threonine aldolase [Natronobacterium gregoryi SP2]ELY64862.1 threonine aldolase [Natronobacterium gregoryi SP2]PLK18368.1 low specificity L-threonine aldolase [Natronobacterium gregoryi SP2]SFJ71472.1 L-threonine aldolase [Natronobacterium gregoryi]